MDTEEFDAVLQLPVAKRYEYFINTIVGSGQIWGLSNEGWASTEYEDGKILIPFWPRKEFAEANISYEWSSCLPEAIDLSKFLADWVPEMINDDVGISVFRAPNGADIEMDLTRLKNDLEMNLKKVEIIEW